MASELMDIVGIFKFGVILAVIALVVTRLLDVRQPWFVKLGLAFFGFIVGLLVTLLLFAQNSDGTIFWLKPEFGVTLIITASSATMVLFVMLELMVRPSRQMRLASPRIPHPLRAIRAWFARTRRYSQITRIAAHYGLSSIFGRRPLSVSRKAPFNTRRLAENFRGALEEAGGVFTKFGQVLSTRPDLLPPEFIEALSGLQDRVAPATVKEIEAIFVEEFGKSADQLFSNFVVEPMAAASIAQAHRARLHTGEAVVVKIQRPGIKALVERDLDILGRLAATIEARSAWGREFRAVDLADGFSAALREELDFKIEAQNVKVTLMAKQSHSKVRIPTVYPEYSTSRILVMEWFDGVSIRDAGSLLDSLSIDRMALARELLRYFMHQMLFEGTFHADPHPGNIMILRSGELALIDFGMVCRLDPLQQLALRRMWIALERRDPTELSAAVLEVAEIRRGVDEFQLERSLSQFMAQRLSAGMEINTALFTALFRLLQTYGLGFSAEISAVFRALMMLDGTLKLLAPDFQLITEARSLAVEWFKEALVPTISDELRVLIPLLLRLPKRLDHIANALEHGTFSTNIRLLADERDTRFLLQLVNTIVLAVLGASMGIISSMLLGTNGGPALTANVSLLHGVGYAGLFVGIVLMMRVIVSLVRPHNS